MSEKLRVLIVEDEPPARRRLRALLEEHDDVTLVGECGDGASAVESITELSPDLVFLDVEIPELTGLQVIDRIGVGRMPPVIFVTAYDRYAVQAFDRAAVDYLLKPFDRDRFERALERGRTLIDRPRELQTRLAALLEGALARTPAGAAGTIAVRVRDRIRILPIKDIDYVTAAGNYVRIHAGRDAYIVRESISAFEERLDTHSFTRVHRSVIVNRTCVRELEPLYRGEYVIWLQDGTRLVSGRTYRARVQEAFGI